MGALFLSKLRKYKKVRGQTVYLLFLWYIYPFCCSTEYALPGLTAEYGGTVLLTVCTVFSLFRREIRRFNGADVLFLLFVCWSGWRLSVEAEVVDNRMFMRGAGCLLLYFYFRCECPVNSFFGLLFGAGILRALWGVLEQAGLWPSCYFGLAGTGGFHNTALWGIFSVVALLAGNTFYGHFRRSWQKWLWGAGMLFLLLAVFLSASRASWLGLAAGIVWLLMLSAWGRTVWENFRCRYTGVSLFLSGCAVVTGIIGIGYGLYVLRPASVEGRYLIWRVIAGAVGEAPLLGHGALSASYMLRQADWFMNHPDSLYAMVADNTIYAFNEFLRVLYECGIVGLLLFAGLLTAVFCRAVKGDAASRRAGALLVAVMCFGLFGYPLSDVQITGLVIVTLGRIAGSGGGHRLWSGVLPSSGRCAVIVVLAVFLFICTEQYIGGKHADRLLFRAQTDLSVLSEGRLSQAYQHWRGNPDFVLCYGKTLYNHAQYDKALPVLQQAAHLKPSSRLLCDIGDCYRHRGDNRAAESSYRLASWMIPTRILPHYRLFCLYRDEGMEAEAAGQAERLLTMPVKVVNTSVLRYRHQARLFLSHYSSQHK